MLEDTCSKKENDLQNLKPDFRLSFESIRHRRSAASAKVPAVQSLSGKTREFWMLRSLCVLIGEKVSKKMIVQGGEDDSQVSKEDETKFTN
ncbi:hypothetical protein NPIL_354741 [Nephila pilipes]|uniref:Uncharacterized protein n=1 Tax=Nephila pilipes TaxID=299642 RepID=A0A8X6MBY0_NEPPI|nr:hypothetical protein NPIL_354741 [Nephila pilipes]